MPYDTVNTRADQYAHGYFSVGTGPEVVVILGSCRVLPYLNYLSYLNSDNRFTLCLIDVVAWYNEPDGKQVEPNEFTKQYENKPELLDILKRCQWFIHEHTENFGMFNTDLGAAKNIYHFGIDPKKDILIPNFNNIFIMFQELVNYDAEIRAGAKEATDQWKWLVKTKGLESLERFLTICRITTIPGFADLFRDTWREKRFFWTGNHVSNWFTSTVFKMINERWLNLPISAEICEKIAALDMYSTPCTPVTKYDVEAYGLTWPGPVEELKIP